MMTVVQWATLKINSLAYNFSKHLNFALITYYNTEKT